MMMLPAGYGPAFGTGGGHAPCMPAPRHFTLDAQWFGYIYDRVGFNRLMAARKIVPQKDADMSIEQFIDNEVKSNDVVLFMKGTPQFPQCGFSGQVVQILDHVGVG